MVEMEAYIKVSNLRTLMREKVGKCSVVQNRLVDFYKVSHFAT